MLKHSTRYPRDSRVRFRLAARAISRNPAHTLKAKSVHNFDVHWKLDTRIIRPRGNFSTEPQNQIMQFVHYTDRI